MLIVYKNIKFNIWKCVNKISSHLGSRYRDKNYSHKEIPDKEEEGENHLAGPVDLTNFNLNLHLLARIAGLGGWDPH